VDASIRLRQYTAAGWGRQVSDRNAQSRIDSICAPDCDLRWIKGLMGRLKAYEEEVWVVWDGGEWCGGWVADGEMSQANRHRLGQLKVTTHFPNAPQTTK
jgi:hypothetical protein